jgi:drug/metabolite transporter (DMT)-like permease
MPPATVVFGRTLLGAAFLVPLAASRRAFRGVRPVIVPVIVVTVLDMAAPTFLTAWGEQHVSSSVAGILTATDPLFTAVLALWLIKSEVPDRRRTAGLIIGFVGVVALLGIDLRGSAMELLGAGAVILSALGYASAALLYRRWLADQAALAITALMTVISALAFLPPAAIDLPRHIPPASSILALAALGIVNTGIAYWLFYLLIDEAGAATASVITYVMPVVALFLGVGLLREQLTIGAIAGLILIAVGAWLATRRQATPSTDADSGTGQSAGDTAMRSRPARTLASIHHTTARPNGYATDFYIEQEFEMTSQPAPPLLAGQVLEISFVTFTPRITIHSERQLTVEIIAGEGAGFSDTVEYEAVAVREDLVVLSWQEHIGSTVVHVLDLSSSHAYTAVTPAKGGFMRLTGRLEVKSGT